MRHHVGIVLAELCVPALDHVSKNEVRASTLRTWILESREWHGLPALPGFLETVPGIADDVATFVRRALVGLYSQRVGNGATAQRKWADLVTNGLGVTLPNNLIDQLVSTIETRHEHGLASLIHTTRYLLERNMLPAEKLPRLLSALKDLFFETQYIGTEAISRKAVSIARPR